MPTVGLGYNTAASKPTSVSIFGFGKVGSDTSGADILGSATIEEDFTSSYNCQFSAFRSLADFRERFRFTSEIGLPVITGVNLNAALEVSDVLSEKNDGIIYVMSFFGIRRRLTIKIDQGRFESDPIFKSARKD